MTVEALRQGGCPFPIDRVTHGDCRDLIPQLPDGSVDVVVTSPPYWGQRASEGTGTERDPRQYLAFLRTVFVDLLPKLADDGILWINMGDSYNTSINWEADDRRYSTLGGGTSVLGANNSAYTKPRFKRRPFLERDAGWLSRGNLLALPYRLVIDLCERGYLFRGEVVWIKPNPMPEGRCVRPHRQHEPIFLLAKSEQHAFRSSPPVGSIWEMKTDRLAGLRHYSRFPIDLPRRCIEAWGSPADELVVVDPFAGSGSVGIAAGQLGAAFIGFEIDIRHAEAANERIVRYGATLPFGAEPTKIPSLFE